MFNKGTYLANMGTAISSPEVVDALHIGWRLAHIGNVERSIWGKDKRVALLLLLGHIVQLSIIHIGTFVHGFANGGMATQPEVNNVNITLLTLTIGTGLGEDDHVADVALTLEESQRNAVGNAAIQQFTPAQVHNARHHRQRSRSPYPLKGLMVYLFQLVVDGFAIV